MKYLFIFLPFFAMAQGGDSTLYGVRASTVDTCWEIKNGWMSLKPGCISIPSFSSNGSVIKFKTIELSPARKVVETFSYNGSKYDLYEDGWRKLTDTIPANGDVKIKCDSVFQWVEEPKWIPCDQHIGKSEPYKREKTDTSEVRLLVWTGCSLAEISATKYLFYNKMQVVKNTGGLAIYITETIKVDVIARYVSGDKWIKPSHVIKEL